MPRCDRQFSDRRCRPIPQCIGRCTGFDRPGVGRHPVSVIASDATRTIRLSEAGERYAVACRRILTELKEADFLAAGESAAPRGLLTLTGPLYSGRQVLRPIIDDFIDQHPTVRARLLLLDRHVNLVEEGIDVGLRIAHLPDSSLIAIRVGQVRRMVCGAPSYLAGKPEIRVPADVSQHACIAMMVFGQDSWSFSAADGIAPPQQVRITPRLVVNTVEAAVDSAVEGRGLVRLFSYQVADEVADGRLQVVLRDSDAAALPVHLIMPEGRLSVAKVRAFVDFAVPRLKERLARMARQ